MVLGALSFACKTSPDAALPSPQPSPAPVEAQPSSRPEAPDPSLSTGGPPSAAMVSEAEAGVPPATFPEPMVRIAAGSLTMGCPASIASTCKDDEKPPHRVELSAFEIDVYEVTVARYKACVDAGVCDHHPLHDHEASFSKNDPRRESWAGVCLGQYHRDHAERPVVCVDAYDAETYCRWRDKRLPTEAEWERAARGDDGRPFPWGAAPPSPALACLGPSLCDVGTHADGASPFGVQDLAGNAAEWVFDRYHPSYYTMSASRDPDGFWDLLPVPLQVCWRPTCRIARGGTFKDDPIDLRATARTPEARDGGRRSWLYEEVGFRCAKGVTPRRLRERGR